MTSNTDPSRGQVASQLRADIELALSRADFRSARLLLGDFWRHDPSPASAGFVVRSFEALLLHTPDSSWKALRVFFLSSYTIDPMLPPLRAAAYVAGIQLVVGQGGFNDAAQLALDSSSALYRFAPELVFIAHQTRDVAPELLSHSDLTPAQQIERCQEITDRLMRVPAAIRARCSATVVLHTLEQPEPALGILDAFAELGQSRALRDVNDALLRAARALSEVYLLDVERVLRRRGTDHMFDERRFASVRMPFASSELMPWVDEWLRFVHPCAGRLAKVLVCDLDNTLWGGVVGEDGLDGIQLGHDHRGAPFQALQRVLLELKQRGVLLALCSKNNPDEALAVLTRHPDMRIRREDIAAHRINWQDKAQNLRELARELNVGLDALVFVDDNPVERAQVRAELPEVHVLELPNSPYGYAAAVRACPRFERLTLTGEDRTRTALYAAEQSRSEARSSAGSLTEFLASLQQEACVEPATDGTLARVAQLTQKTNQFNLTTRRYTLTELQTLRQEAGVVILTIRVRDRFGDHGLVGVAIVRAHGALAELDTFLLSCRVLARGVESALLSAVCEHARALSADTLEAAFLQTEKNVPARELLPAHGFQQIAESAAARHYRLPLALAPAWPSFITRLDLPPTTGENDVRPTNESTL